MERLLSLVSEGTKAKLESLMKEQEKVVGLAVSEALGKITKSDAFLAQVNKTLSEYTQEMIENYLEWRFEDGVDYNSEDFKPLHSLLKESIKHLVNTEKARKLASDAVKRYIEDFFNNDDAWNDDDTAEEITAAAKNIMHEQIQHIMNDRDLELGQEVREKLLEIISDRACEEVDENW